MKERKYVKLRVDMYDDTKFKIIDMKPERDLIHYTWTRLLALAGKVNLEGDLYLSKNMPYTIETLAIEFHRDSSQVKSALEVLMELEMVELTNDKVYRIKNFAKHQNIKVKDKEKNEVGVKVEAEINEEVQANESLKNEIVVDNHKKAKGKTIQNENESIKANKVITLENTNNNIGKVNENVDILTDIAYKQDDIPVLLKSKSKRSYKRKSKNEAINVTDEEVDNILPSSLREGIMERPLGKEEAVVGQWTFSG